MRNKVYIKTMKLESQINLLYHLLIYLKVNISKKAVEKELEKHPFRFSLLALSDVLSNFDVGNTAYHVEINELDALPLPVIVHTANEEFICIIKLEEDQAIYLTATGTTANITREKLTDIFTGAVLTIDNNLEKAFSFDIRDVWKDSMKTPLLITITTMIVCGVFLSQHTSASGGILVLFLEIVAGLLVALLLLIQSFNKDNVLIRKICGMSSKLNCNHILSSEQANLTPFLSLSECCLFYFSGSLLFLLSNNQEPSTLLLLFCLNVLGLPFTAYSLFYQYKLKGWYMLCCTTVLLLWMEAITLSQIARLDYSLADGRILLFFGLSFMLPILVWIIIKPLILASLELKKVKRELSTFKYNDSIFKLALNGERKYKLVDEQQAIVLGTGDSANVITIVSNPFCKPCAAAHSLLDHWLKAGINFKLQLIFAVPGNDSTGNEISSQLYTIYRAGDEAVTRTAVNDWFKWGTQDTSEWKKRYAKPINPDAEDYIARQRQWINHVKIQFTPTLFINGTRLPELYQLEDVQYMLT